MNLLPEERKRAGLVAITRDVPTHGELQAGAKGWLGAVRWARLYDEGLAALPIQDRDVALQWKLLCEVMHSQGDLGLTAVNRELIVAWARFQEARDHLRDILDNVRAPALECLRDQLSAKHGRFGQKAMLAAQHHAGKAESVAVKREQGMVWTGFRVPAAINRPAVVLCFWPEGGEPMFLVEVRPWKASERSDDRERQLLTAAKTLAGSGFKSGYSNYELAWWNEHSPRNYLYEEDVPARLVELIERNIITIVSSGILSYDLQAAAEGGRGGPPRVKGKK